jgi:hypothetical protein
MMPAKSGLNKPPWRDVTPYRNSLDAVPRLRAHPTAPHQNGGETRD